MSPSPITAESLDVLRLTRPPRATLALALLAIGTACGAAQERPATATPEARRSAEERAATPGGTEHRQVTPSQALPASQLTGRGPGSVKEAVRRAIRRNVAGLNACYAPTLRHHADADARRVVIGFRLGVDGSISDVRVTAETHTRAGPDGAETVQRVEGPSALSDCLVAFVESLRVDPRHAPSEAVDISYPFQVDLSR
jgi:hypothetical protein